MGSELSAEFPSPRHYDILDYGYCKVWKRKESKVQAMEEYEISIESQASLDCYKNMWSIRTQNDGIVAVHYFTHRPSKQVCGVFQQGSILTERIPYRLSQFSNIPYEETLTVVNLALEGYQALHNEYGLFLVRSTMIGINNDRKVKVWHHTDLSAAQPENVNCRKLTEMLWSIIESVEKNGDYPYSNPRFSQFVAADKGNYLSSFGSALNSLQKYRKRYNFRSETNLLKLTKYLRQAQGWEQLTYNAHFFSKLSSSSHSSFGKFSFKRSVDRSLSSSQRTLRNDQSPRNLNIYTQPQMKQMTDTVAYNRNSFQEYGISPLKQHKPIVKYSQLPSQIKSPVESSCSSQSRGLEPIKMNKIEFTIPARSIKSPNRQNFPSPNYGGYTQASSSKASKQQSNGNSVYGVKKHEISWGLNQAVKRDSFFQRKQSSSGSSYKKSSSLASSISFMENKQIRQAMASALNNPMEPDKLGAR